MPDTESALYVPLRSNAKSLVTGVPIAALRRRLKYASVFHDTRILESGTLRMHSGAGGSFSSVDPPIADKVLPRLVRARVERVTLTGGEPFAHPDLDAICDAVVALGLPLGICTNATLASDEQIAHLARSGAVHVNVSFDGFRPESHGKFCGSVSSFATTLETTRKFAAAGMLQGLLSTPNMLTEPGEFAALCEFAVEVGARYVLMNPLSAFGRGVKSQGKLAADAARMRAIRDVTEGFRSRGIDLVHIRFPNDDKSGMYRGWPLGSGGRPGDPPSPWTPPCTG